MKFLKFLYKIIKWIVIFIISFYFFGILIFGFSATSERKGIHKFKWSGLEGLFQQEGLSLQINERIETAFNGIDGPYIIKNTIYRVDSEHNIIRESLLHEDSIAVLVHNKDKDQFFVSLKKAHRVPDPKYQLPEKLIAISDIEGNFDGFVSFLIENGVIDENFDWIFGSGHLVLPGDFVDRGENVLPVLWLIYKLEQQAEPAGGQVHFILGNHEVMNIRGNGSYARGKYKKIAQTLSGEEDWDKAFRYMYSTETELGRWLRSKNSVEKIGSYLFQHGGISPELARQKISLEKINDIVRLNLDRPLGQSAPDSSSLLIMGEKGPLWYRGYLRSDKNYEKIKESDLDFILQTYEANKVVIGHSIVKDVSASYNGKVIRIDVKHGKHKYSGETKGFLVENGIEYVINDLGERKGL